MGVRPAYIMHDWIFAAHHCLVHGKPDPKEPIEYEKVKRFTLTTPLSFAEVMKTLMVAKNRSAKRRAGPQSCEHVSAKHVRDIELVLRSSGTKPFIAADQARRSPPVIVYSQPY